MKKVYLTIGLMLAAAMAVAQPPVPNATAITENSDHEQAVSDQLAAARKQLAILRARHGEKHPAVEKQLRTVTELQKKLKDDGAKEPGDKAAQIEKAKRELNALRERYTDQHPLVKGQLQKIAELERSGTQ